MRVLVALIILILSSCGYRAVDFTERAEEGKLNEYFCIKEFNTPLGEPTAHDIFYRYITNAIISAGYKIECSDKTNRYMYINIPRISVGSIGYSENQRASIYRISAKMNIKIENRKRETLLNRTISETTQYAGVGVSGELQRRYAIEEIARLFELRVFSLLTREEKYKKDNQ
jgi:hypothetical protein